MIGLRDLRLPPVHSWADAYDQFQLPPVERYDIASDCLRGDAGRAAITEVLGNDVRTVTVGELDRLSASLANGLVAHGLTAGDRVAIKLSQSVDMAVAVFGVLRAGGVVLPLSNVLAEDGLRHRIGDAGPRTLIATGTDAEVALARDAGLTLITIDELPGTPNLSRLAQAGSTQPPDRTHAAIDDPALLLYTSGTSGKPKGVLHSNQFLLGHHALDLAFDRVRDADVAYSPVDWAWGGGLMLGLLGPLAYGVPVVAFREPHFDPERAMQLMTALGVSIGLFPPTVLRMLRASGALEAEAVGRSRLRCFITGAEAVEADLFAWAGSIGLGVNNAFGQTEANALIGHARVLGTLDPAALGRPYPGHRVDVLDDDLQPVQRGEQGQLAVAADDPACMMGYWNAPEATAAKIRGGWLLTGDTAHRDDDGVLYFHGRSDDIIKSGAYRLGPAEIEAAIRKSPLVEDCAVVGLPDAIRGEIVSAVVTLRPGATASSELTTELRDLVRSSVGAHAYPRDVRYVDTLPKTTTGKVDRTTLRASLIAEGSPA